MARAPGSLPICLSVPHAGLRVPRWLRGRFLLTPEQIALDGDTEADAVYLPLRGLVRSLVTTPVARAVLDMNRAADDNRDDGIVKTVSCWRDPVWGEPLAAAEMQRLIETHWRRYHDALSAAARDPWVRFGVDGHTMAAVAPPIAPDVGQQRPAACIGTGRGAFPDLWAERLRVILAEELEDKVTIDVPFGGGHITRFHGREMPWVQIELARGGTLSADEKRRAVGAALQRFVADEFGSG